MAVGDIVAIQIDAIGHEGQGLGRHEGKVIFSPYTLPGERIEMRIVEERRRWSRAEPLRVLESSPHRVQPPCPYFGFCGGCQWQHIDAPAQPALKQQAVVDQLQRIGHISTPPVQPTLGMADPWFYRNHVQFSLTPSGRLGFQAALSHDVVAIDRCLLLHPLLGELHGELNVEWHDIRRLVLRAGIHTAERMVILEDTDPEAALPVCAPFLSCVLQLPGGSERVVSGAGFYHEVLHGRTFRISADSFFQVNTLQAEVLLDVVQEYVEPQRDDVLLDVYCGVGTMGLALSDQVGRVIGVEEHPAAIEDARANAQGSQAVTLIRGPAEQVLSRLDDRIGKVIIDPPRQGCEPAVIAALLRLAPRRLVYVSCSPSTLARDALLLAEGGYHLRRVQPVDMFPQTFHLETVSLWEPGE